MFCPTPVLTGNHSQGPIKAEFTPRYNQMLNHLTRPAYASLYHTTMKTCTIACAIGLIGIIAVSCTRNVKQEAVQETKIPKVMELPNVDPNDVFALNREGQTVTIQIKIDFSACKSINILRNTTGIARNQTPVARLDSNAREFEDSPPDSRAYWYWLRAIPSKGEPKSFGPIRVAPDTDSTIPYPNVVESYPWTVRRTYTSATISWDFPNDRLRNITIRRNTSESMSKRKTVLETLEWSSNQIDPLPDTEADYWYWIEAWLDTGAIIFQGPIKAEFSGN
jgi:hypothetical protein